MAENEENYLQSSIGSSIRQHRLRVGMTQVQLARAISRSGKFLSEVETGKVRICHRDLEKLADAMGVASERMLETDAGDGDKTGWGTPRRIRDVQPTGMAILSFSQLVSYLERSGWLRGANLWMISAEPFPEESDLALVEQVASVVASKNVSLRYVFGVDRLNDQEREQLSRTQGSVDALPASLLRALRWSSVMRSGATTLVDRVAGYAVSTPLPPLCRCHTLLWVETEDVSWSDVMPLLYCRAVTRMFEKPNESTPFWHHLPRDEGSNLLLGLAHQLRALPPRKREEP